MCAQISPKAKIRKQKLKCNQRRKRNGLRSRSSRWPNGILLCELTSSLNTRKKEKIRYLLEKLETARDSCIKFKEASSGKRMIVNSGIGCSSTVGYLQWGVMTLAEECFNDGTIQHEFLHAIGLYHHQSRSDRNKYVNILSHNILRGQESNFKKISSWYVNHYDLPYDYRSIMHYSGYAWSRNRQLTIQTLDRSKQHLLGSITPSKGDIQLVKKMYGCKDKGKLLSLIHI